MKLYLLISLIVLCSLVSGEVQLRIEIPSCTNYRYPGSPPTSPYVSTFSLSATEACSLTFPLNVGAQTRAMVGETRIRVRYPSRVRITGYECDTEDAVKCDSFRVINGRDYVFTRKPIHIYFSNFEGVSPADIEVSIQQTNAKL